MRKTNLIHFILRSHNVRYSTKGPELKMDSNLCSLNGHYIVNVG